MDSNLWVLTLILFIHLKHLVSGDIDVTVHMWEGNVTVTWVPTQEIPGTYLYQVELATTDFPNVWKNITHCAHLKATICNIGNISSEVTFDVRVGVLINQSILWTFSKHHNIRDSQLLAPTFNLTSTTFSVQVSIDSKKNLDDIFPYGLQYTAYLWQKGQENKTMMKTQDDTEEIIFSSMESLQVYCVYVRVESLSSVTSNISSVKCIKVPLDSSMLILYTLILGLLGILALLFLIVRFLKHHREMPNALKPILNEWRPMIVGPVQVETVTDKGWILSLHDPKSKMLMSEGKNTFEEDKERRESMDSGVSMDQLHLSHNSTMTDGQIGDIPVDSGCGSLKGADGCENTTKYTAELVSLNEINHVESSEGKDDSGLGLSHHEADTSEKDDTGLLSEVVVGDGYRSQSPSNVDVQCETTKPRGMDTNTAAIRCGYRVDQMTCMCSEQEQCIWCKSKKDCQPLIKEQTDHCQLTLQTDECDSLISTYLRKSMGQTAHILNVEGKNTLISQEDTICNESSALLLTYEMSQSSIMNTRLFTLDDVHLTYS